MDEQGVVPLICECCGRVVGVENADAWKARQKQGVAYICRRCWHLPADEIEARLLAQAALGEALRWYITTWRSPQPHADEFYLPAANGQDVFTLYAAAQQASAEAICASC